MKPAKDKLEATSALLERAYRMALLLQSRTYPEDAGLELALEQATVASELVEILDEARASLVCQSRDQSGWQRSAKVIKEQQWSAIG